LALATSLASDSAWQEWQQWPSEAQEAESELRNVVANQVERAAKGGGSEEADAGLSISLERWAETIQRLSLKGTRIQLVARIAAETRQIGEKPATA
jgi:hypothetical protein